jgi:hypothetical protein
MHDPAFWALFLGGTAFLAGVYGAWQRFVQIAWTENNPASTEQSVGPKARNTRLKAS